MPTKTPVNEKPPVETEDLAAEFAVLGRKLRDTLNTAWTSEERHKIQREIEDGLIRLRDELNSAAKTVRASEPAKKVETEVKKVRGDIETGKIGDDVRKGLIVGLRGLGSALDKLADSFTPLDQTPKK